MYERKHIGRARRRPMGDITGDIAKVLSQAGGALGAGAAVASDPYVPEVICRLTQLAAIEQKKPVPSCAKTPSNLRGGVGIRNVIIPLRGYVYAQQHPWAYVVAAAGVIGLPMFLGYLLGKGSR